jgi:RHS repeat-associated protein
MNSSVRKQLFLLILLTAATLAITQSAFAQAQPAPSFSLASAAYTYNSDNQVVSSTSGESFVYDDNGNLTERTLPGAGRITLGYNPDNQLVNYTSEPTKLSFTYDALGNRIRKASGSSITKYIVDPNRSLPGVLAESDASGKITAYYVYGLGLISKITGSSAYFYQYDGLGSTVAITDKDGKVLNQYAYDDFGNLATNSTESLTNPFKYVGKFGVMTDLPDLLYMRARYYSPSIGRFINKDPIQILNVELNQLLNRYLYVENNPISRKDPKGEFIEPSTAAWILIGAMVVWFANWIAQQLRDTGTEFIEAPGPAEEPIVDPLQ